MTTQNITEAAVARLRAAGLPEAAAQVLAVRVAATLEHLRQQAEALPPETEPATAFVASRPVPGRATDR